MSYRCELSLYAPVCTERNGGYAPLLACSSKQCHECSAHLSIWLLLRLFCANPTLNPKKRARLLNKHFSIALFHFAGIDNVHHLFVSKIKQTITSILQWTLSDFERENTHKYIYIFKWCGRRSTASVDQLNLCVYSQLLKLWSVWIRCGVECRHKLTILL